jgi:hypothetical protein
MEHAVPRGKQLLHEEKRRRTKCERQAKSMKRKMKLGEEMK